MCCHIYSGCPSSREGCAVFTASWTVDDIHVLGRRKYVRYRSVVKSSWGVPLFCNRSCFLFNVQIQFTCPSLCFVPKSGKHLLPKFTQALSLMTLTIFSSWSNLNAVFHNEALTVSDFENTNVRSLNVKYTWKFESVFGNPLALMTGGKRPWMFTLRNKTSASLCFHLLAEIPGTNLDALESM